MPQLTFPTRPDVMVGLSVQAVSQPIPPAALTEPAVRRASATLKVLVLALAEAPPASLTETEKVWLLTSSA
jgi:hypothetical protein